jgi:hypothetical protein
MGLGLLFLAKSADRPIFWYIPGKPPDYIVRRTSAAEIKTDCRPAAGAEGKNPLRLDFNNR